MSTSHPTQTASGRLLSALHQRGPMSRAQATSVAALARSAAGNAADELESLGLIRSSAAIGRQGMRGRPSAELEVEPAGAAAIAIQLQRDTVEIALVDLGREFLHRESHALDVVELGPAATLERIGALVTELTVSHPALRIIGIGLSLPGIVGRDDGVAHAVLSLGWRNVPVAALLKPHLPRTVALTLGHDATLGALAEFRAGAGRGAHRLLFITSEPVGVGAAMITSAQELGQVVDHALQAGHLAVDPRGPLCLCGSHGCLELFVDGRAIGALLGLPTDTDSSVVLDRLAGMSRADADAQGLGTMIDTLQIGLVSLVNTLGPDRVVLSGLLSPFAQLYADRLDEAMQHAVVAQVEPVSLTASVLEDAVLLGAAEAAFEALLSDPASVLADRVEMAGQSRVRS